MSIRRIKIKRAFVLSVITVCIFYSTNIMSVSAKTSSRNVFMKNGYTQQLSFNVGKTSGSADFDIVNGGFCSMKVDILAIEYNSSGKFVRNVAGTNKTQNGKYTSAKVARKSGASDTIKNYIASGYNYSTTVKSRVAANTYFEAVEIGSHSVKTKIINP